MKYLLKWCFGGLSLLMSCNGSSPEQAPAELPEPLPYSIHEPDRVFELPDALAEISGLEKANEQQLLCNEDETGYLYLFDLEQETVVHTWKWGKDGDYEGVAMMGSKAYVLSSNGSLYEIQDFTSYNSDTSSSAAVRKLNTGLGKGCDAEGLCQLPGTNSLLIACKEGKGGSRNIYQFSPEFPDSLATPYLEIDVGEVENRILSTDIDKVSLSMRKLLDPKTSSGILFPSAIAVHPATQDLYILSARSRLLVVYNQEGKLKAVEELKHKGFSQPEAITFTANADLYIGNEGNGRKANILKFSYVQP